MRHPIKCPNCDRDLRQPNSVEINFASNGGHTWQQLSQVEEDGTLADPTGDVESGLHAGSYCYGCDELLDEL